MGIENHKFQKRKLKDDILKLRSEGYSHRQIAKLLNCNRGLVSYHCGNGVKNRINEKRKNYHKNHISNTHPYKQKYWNFVLQKQKIQNTEFQQYTFKKICSQKLKIFNERGNMSENKPTLEEVMNFLGDSPVCYLTGTPIDPMKSSTYSFDHKIPVSRGGSNSLDNLGICTKQANQCKSNMTPEELIEFCKSVLQYNGYKISSSDSI